MGLGGLVKIKNFEFWGMIIMAAIGLVIISFIWLLGSANMLYIRSICFYMNSVAEPYVYTPAKVSCDIGIQKNSFVL